MINSVIGYYLPKDDRYYYLNENYLSKLQMPAYSSEGSTLYLIDYDADYFLLRYLDVNGKVSYANEQLHFDNLLIRKAIWFESVTVALDQYFAMAERLIVDAENPPKSYLPKYVELWSELKGKMLINT